MPRKLTPKKEEKKEPIKKTPVKKTVVKPKGEIKEEKPVLKKTPVKKIETKTPATPTKKAAPKKQPVKKEPTNNVESKPEPEVHIPIIERAGFSKTKRFKEDKYEKIATTATKEQFNEMGRKVSEGLIEWSYYGVDGDIGYHFYLVLDNNRKKK